MSDTIQIRQTPGSGLYGASCSMAPICPETFDDLRVAKGLPVHEKHVHGDPYVDELRIARSVETKTRKTLLIATEKVESVSHRYYIGVNCECLLDDLLDGKAESMDSWWFVRRAQSVIESVKDAAGDEDEMAAPESGSWPELKALAAAMQAHGAALKQLGEAEKRAIQCPSNVELVRPLPAWAEDELGEMVQIMEDAANTAAGSGLHGATCYAHS